MQNANAIVLSAGMAQVFLTLLVEVVLYQRRIPEMQRRQIDPQSLDTSFKGSGVLEDTRASDNFKNLFEMPVLFYFLCTVVLVTKIADEFLAVSSVAYVCLRYLHSAIQCTGNRVIVRFSVFILSSLALLVMWIDIAYRLWA